MKIISCGKGADGSEQYIMKSTHGGQVQFATIGTEMCAHTWMCPKEGKKFLGELERHAEQVQKELTVCTVLSPALQTILKQNGYSMHIEEFELGEFGTESCEVWKKEART